MEEHPSQATVNEGVTNGDITAAYAAPTNQSSASASVALSANVAFSPAFQSAPPIILPQPSDQHQIPPLEVPLQTFWSDKLSEIKHTTDFNFHSLPLRRIKKIMQTDEDVQRISDDALVFFAKACEMFIQDLTLRAWHHTKENKRRTLQSYDISVALARTDVFDFLVEISPLGKQKGECVGLPANSLVHPPPQMVQQWNPADPLLPPTPQMEGDGLGLQRTKATESIALLGNAAALPQATPPTKNKVLPNLHLENFKPEPDYMGSRPRNVHHHQVPLCKINVDPCPLPDSEVRDWSELPLDALSSIFMKLGTIEILMGAGLVCHSWLAAAKVPELWRFVDMTRHKLVFSKGVGTMCAMAKVAIHRSEGQMQSFWAQKFVTSELLDYMASRTDSLKSIRLIGCTFISPESLAMLAAKCPFLQEIECSHHKMPAGLFRYLGSVWPQLKRLRIHMQWFDSDQIMRELEMENRQHDDDEDEFEEPKESDEAWEARQNKDAFAIAESLHELRVLRMEGNSLTNIGVYAILEACPHLECLDISECYHVDVNDELKARCARLKHVWLPRQRDYVRCPDLRVIGENEGEDCGLTMHDLWEAKVESLCVEAEMDKDGSYDDYIYWDDY